jgi:hypothetical protein
VVYLTFASLIEWSTLRCRTHKYWNSSEKNTTAYFDPPPVKKKSKYNNIDTRSTCSASPSRFPSQNLITASVKWSIGKAMPKAGILKTTKDLLESRFWQGCLIVRVMRSF